MFNIYKTYYIFNPKELVEIMKTLEELKTEVEENSAVVDSAVVLLKGLSEMVRNLKPDAQAISDLADKLDAKSNELANAVTENTPVE